MKIYKKFRSTKYKTASRKKKIDSSGMFKEWEK